MRLLCAAVRLMWSCYQPHDAQVADGAPLDVVLTVGYYDERECTVSGLALADYTAAFDLCTEQASMALVQELIQELIQDA